MPCLSVSLISFPLKSPDSKVREEIPSDDSLAESVNSQHFTGGPAGGSVAQTLGWAWLVIGADCGRVGGSGGRGSGDWEFGGLDSWVTFPTLGGGVACQ